MLEELSMMDVATAIRVSVSNNTASKFQCFISIPHDVTNPHNVCHVHFLTMNTPYYINHKSNLNLYNYLLMKWDLRSINSCTDAMDQSLHRYYKIHDMFTKSLLILAFPLPLWAAVTTDGTPHTCTPVLIHTHLHSYT